MTVVDGTISGFSNITQWEFTIVFRVSGDDVVPTVLMQIAGVEVIKVGSVKWSCNVAGVTDRDEVRIAAGSDYVHCIVQTQPVPQFVMVVAPVKKGVPLETGSLMNQQTRVGVESIEFKTVQGETDSELGVAIVEVKVDVKDPDKVVFVGAAIDDLPIEVAENYVLRYLATKRVLYEELEVTVYKSQGLLPPRKKDSGEETMEPIARNRVDV